jgi:hypothetical protein
MNQIIGLYVAAFMQLLCSCNQKAEPEIYLIPSDFVGKVNVLFNEESGAAKEYDRKRRVYKIPSDGILLTQFRTNDGIIDREYYSVDNIGKRTLLEVYMINNSKRDTAEYIVRDKNKKGIFGDGTSGQYGSTNDSKSVQYQEFIVSNYNQLDSFYTREYMRNFDKKIESITRLTLNLK